MSTKGAPGARVWVVLGSLGILVTAIAWWQVRGTHEPIVVHREPAGIMGTSSSIVAVLPGRQAADGARVLDAAESELRRLEALFSTWIEASELSHFNRATAGRKVALAPEAMDLLQLAAELYEATGGAFDVTARPLIERWREATQSGRVPEHTELEQLRAASGWADLSFSPQGVTKSRDTVRVDVDGIAKGLAIDRALAALQSAGAVGGMIEVGGDLAVFGSPPGGGGWPVGIRDPFAERVSGRIELSLGAVCTSGGYARYLEIEGKRYGHILDPRTGEPVSEVASVTAIAANAAIADAWATALTVLGAEGLSRLPPGVEALLVFDRTEAPRAVASPGFPPIVDVEALTREGG